MIWELRVEEPMVDMHYFKNPAFSTGTGGMILMFLSLYGVLFLLTQYLQLVHGYSALNAAFRMLPIAIVMLFVAPLTPRLSKRLGAHRLVSIGMLFVAGGFAVFTTLGLHTAYWEMLFAFFPLTIGIALTMSPMTASIMAAVPARRAGAGSAMNDASRELGAALGIAVLGSVAASKYSNQLSHLIGSLPSAVQSNANKSLAGALQVANGLSGAKSEALILGSKNAFIQGMHLAAIVGAVLCLFAAFLHLQVPAPLARAQGCDEGAARIVRRCGRAGRRRYAADVRRRSRRDRRPPRRSDRLHVRGRGPRARRRVARPGRGACATRPDRTSVGSRVRFLNDANGVRA